MRIHKGIHREYTAFHQIPQEYTVYFRTENPNQAKPELVALEYTQEYTVKWKYTRNTQGGR